MSITITLPDELADGLARQARGRLMSVEQWATQILEQAVGADGARAAWFELNSRRLALIAKKCATGLTDAEAAELATLQDAAAKASEPSDKRMLARLSACEERANYRAAQTDE
jgi:hypothetical protein